MNRYEVIFRRLRRLVPDVLDLEAGSARASRPGEPWLDLHLDVLERGKKDGHEFVKIALAHYIKRNGDSIPNPDMEVRVWLGTGMAEALTFQTGDFYRRVYPEPETVDLGQKREQNEFLAMWLLNAWRQGHRLGPDTTRGDA